MAADGEIIIDTKIDTSGIEKGTSDIEAACKKAASSVERIGEKAAESLGGKQDVAGVQSVYDQIVESLKGSVEKLKGVTSSVIAPIKNAFNELKAAAPNGDDLSGRTQTDEYKKLNAEIEKLSQNLAKVDAKKRKFMSTGGNENSRTFQQMEYDGNLISEMLERAIEKKRELEASGGAYISEKKGIDQFSASASKASGISSKLAAAGSKIVSVWKKVGSTLWGVAKKGLSSVASLAKKSLSTIASLSKKAASGMLGLSKGSGKVGSSMQGGLKTILKYGLGIRSLYSLVNKLRSALVSGMTNLAKYSSSANANISAMQSSITRLKNSVAAAFSPILSIVAPIVTKLINLLATAISYIGAFFAALSGSKTYTKAIAVTENFAGAMNNAGSAAGGAADAMQEYLSGLDEIKKFDDGSSSGGGGGGGGGGGTGPMFEEAEIPGLATDWADKFKDAWAKADFTEIGTIVGTKLRDALENIPWGPIQNTCNKIARSVATFINGFVATPGLWEVVGSTIGNGINTAVGMWNTFFDTTNFVAIGSAIGTALNHAIQTINWAELGRALTQKLKAAIDTMYGFVTTFDWNKFGAAISTALNGAVRNIDFAKAGTTLTTGMIGALNALTTAIQTFDWVGLFERIKTFFANGDWAGVGTAGANALNAAFKSTIWSAAGEALCAALNAAIIMLQKFIEKIHWSDIGTSIGNFLSSAIFGIRADAFGNAVGNLVNGIFTLIQSALRAFPAKNVASILTTSLNTALHTIDFENIGATIGDVIMWIIDFFVETVAGTDWEELGTSIGEMINGCLGRIDVVEFFQGVRNLAYSLLDSLVSAFKALDKGLLIATIADVTFQMFFGGIWDAIQWIGDKIGIKIPEINFSQMYKEFKGIGDKSGTNLADGLENGDGTGTLQSKLGTVVSNSVHSFDTMPTSITQKSQEAHDGALGVWATTSTDYKTISDAASTSFDTFKTNVATTSTEAYNNAKNAWSGAKSDYSTVSNDVTSGFDSLDKNVRSTFEKSYKNASSAWKSSKSDFTKISNNIAKAFNGLPKSIQTTFDTAFTNAKKSWSSSASAFRTISNNIASAFNNLPNQLRSTFTSAFNSAKSAWNSAQSSFHSISASIISGFGQLESGIRIKFTSAYNSARNAWNSARNDFSSTSRAIVDSFATLSNGISTKFRDAYSGARTAWYTSSRDFSDIANGIINSFSSIPNGLRSYFQQAMGAVYSLDWNGLGYNVTYSIIRGMYTTNGLYSWASWFLGNIYLDGSSIGYNLTRGIIRGMYTTDGLPAWASWFTSKAKSAVGVHSPSKLFRDEIGYYLGLGIVAGLQDSTPEMIKSVKSISDDIIDGFRDGISNAKIAAPIINDSIFPNVPVKMPILASGTVIPPKTSLSRNSEAKTNDTLEQLLGAIEKITSGSNSTNGTGGRTIHNVIQLNRRTLYEEMVKEEDLVRSQSGR